MLVKMWLVGRAKKTVSVYRKDAENFLSSVAMPLADVRLQDVQTWFASLTGASASRNRRLAAIKSLYRFGVENELLEKNPALAVKPDKLRSDMAERIISEADVLRMIEAEKNDRKRVALRFLYVAGVRVSEAADAKWRDVARKKTHANLSVFGKGSKLRTFSIPLTLLADLESIRLDKTPDAPLLLGQDGRAISVDAIRRLVAAAAKRAGITTRVTPHWLRHCCASHALDNGAALHVVQRQLGHSSVATTGGYAHAQDGVGASNYLKG
ncbi:tyrosine-type recombinase/integrase [Acetobacter sacchari]|uniref:Tyrosine-type recombinase/integrase n=1 Tax=Acetobacter sacchari TaxID=2661687 RepID=A0ABS3M0W2_9PROT|nr:tyrosine-type recombinase/integrase [Acetobacter sacchari]MBO1361791.1 tyrosine-type recombinase/integrase [Acetobacter sacchari]